MTKTLLYATPMMALLALLLTACAPATKLAVVSTTAPVSTSKVTPTLLASREAQVQSIEIQVLGIDPAHVNAVVRGNLTESCATLGESQVHYAANTFQITIYAASPTDRGCVQMSSPFQAAIPLDTHEMPSGTYTVVANGVSGVFTWPAEVATPTGSPTATAIATAAPISRACTDAAAFVADVTVPDN